jgi:hypothetical protein
MKKIILCVMLFTGMCMSVYAAEQNSGDYLMAQVQGDRMRNDGRPDLRDDLQNRKDNREANKGSTKDGSSSANSKTNRADIAICPGEFAFCASSTCEKTGKMITVKENGGKTTKQYPEVACKCPIVTKELATKNGVPLEGIAALNEGNMDGSCIRPAPGKIWSYFSDKIKYYPQESTTPPFETREAVQQSCDAKKDRGGSNCWSYLCTIDPKAVNTKTGEVRTATCLCPSNEGLFGAQARKDKPYTTFAGTYSQQPANACQRYPVGFPDQLLQ